MNTKCIVDGTYEELERLLRQVADDGKCHTGWHEQRLHNLVANWHEVECNAECNGSFCRFMRPSEWAGYMGYKNLYELIDSLDPTQQFVRFTPKGSAIDPLKASWAIRPGHYNP